MITKWSELPNAIHIEQLASRTCWAPHRAGDIDVAVSSAYNLALETTLDNDRYYAWHDLLINLPPELNLQPVMQYAAIALVAYDDSAHLLDSTAEEIKLLVALGHPYAVLFLYSAIFTK